MKLGDNMTTEAYNIWGDVPPRKCRPPKIGDIPKHSAVDEESPGSVSKSLTGIPSDSEDCSLNLPLDSPSHIVFPLESTSSPEKLLRVRKYEPRSVESSTDATKFQIPPGNGRSSQNFGNKLTDFSSVLGQDSRRITKQLRQESSTRKLPESRKSRNHARKIFRDSESKVTIKLPSKSTERVDSFKIASSPEDSDQEIVEVRKDSALFLEEGEGLPNFREIFKSRTPRVIRPRRESSGYASNLGTFDEDRNSSDVLQDLSSFLKERRRSSVGPKRLNSRVIISRAEEVNNVCADKMPTTEVHRKMSGSGLEMPNIEEVKEVLRDEISSRQDSLDDLCDLVKHVSTEEMSERCRLMEQPKDQEVSSTNHARTATEILNISNTCIRGNHQDLSTSVLDTASLSESINRVSTSRNTWNLVHQCSIPSSSNSKDIQLKTTIGVEETAIPSPLNEETVDRKLMRCNRDETDSIKYDVDVKELPKTIKVYQLLSTQSEDRSDCELHLNDRRISLQISKHDDPTPSVISSNDLKGVFLRERENVAPLKGALNEARLQGSEGIADSLPVRKVSSPGNVGTCQRFLEESSNVTVRPIYPYCPYSPYGSPQGSPRNRRRPLRESRRVSIDNRQGALQLNQYKLLDNIGQGSYGIVKLVYNEEDETHYAMKILSKKKLMKKAGIFGRMAPGRKGAANPLAKVYREIALLKKLDHLNVVKLVEVLDDPDEDNLYLVFELVQRGEILQIPTDKPLDEETARKNFRDVVMGVEYLHYQRIVHRDIKPSNLLVDSDGRIKIADLGVSAELRASGELLFGPAGTPAFAAPETTTPGAHYSGTLCDVWSMGVTLYSLVTGRIPWDGAGSVIGVQVAARSEPLKFPEKPVLSQDLRELLLRMLAKDPAERITLSKIKEHPWLTNRGLEPLPSETENCRLPVTVTDEEVERVVTRIPKLDTLILIKTMLKQHSFQNPFLPKKSGKAACTDAVVNSIEMSSAGRAEEALSTGSTMRMAKTERFQRAGRSNSAPDSYDWQTNGRQISVDSSLPPVTEASSQETEIEKR